MMAAYRAGQPAAEAAEQAVPVSVMLHLAALTTSGDSIQAFFRASECVA